MNVVLSRLIFFLFVTNLNGWDSVLNNSLFYFKIKVIILNFWLCFYFFFIDIIYIFPSGQMHYCLTCSQENQEVSLNEIRSLLFFPVKSLKDHAIVVEHIFSYIIMSSAIVLNQKTALWIWTWMIWQHLQSTKE